MSRHGVFGIAPVDVATEAAHYGCYLLTHLELAAERVRNGADSLNAQDSREAKIRRLAPVGKEFGPVQPERLDADEYMARGCDGNGPPLDDRTAASSGFRRDRGFVDDPGERRG